MDITIRSDLSGAGDNTIRSDLSDVEGNTTRTIKGKLGAHPPPPTPRAAAKARVGLPAGGIPGFAIGRRLGAGGMGQVYEATRESDGRLVALKLLRADAVADPEFRTRFQRE